MTAGHAPLLAPGAQHGARSTHRALLLALATALAAYYAGRHSACGAAAAGAAPAGAAPAALPEAELHARGLWRSPRLGVDAFIVRRAKGGGGGAVWEVLLVKRKKDPFKGAWCLPGGFVNWMEDPVDAAAREVKEETRLVVDRKAPPAFITFKGSPTRDPRAHSLSVTYAVKVEAASLAQLQSGDDAGATAWFPLKQAADGKSLRFAFDFQEILRDCAAWFEAHGEAAGMFVEAGAR
ncbi:MAG: NUDIX hydrolase domain-like protein [Monoraphidium minutum]|nr:MAG: NUDIX hydrolase domain-like protein [Monoraphidium minutum]